MRISDWSSDVCSSDLRRCPAPCRRGGGGDDPGGGGDLRREREGDHSAAELGDPGGRYHRCGRRPRGGLPGCASARPRRQIGRASCRERVWQDVWVAVGACTLKKKKKTKAENIQ